jgi:hypothetical protein
MSGGCSASGPASTDGTASASFDPSPGAASLAAGLAELLLQPMEVVPTTARVQASIAAKRIAYGRIKVLGSFQRSSPTHRHALT